MKRLNHLNVYIRLLIFITLAISLITSGITFILFVGVQKEDILIDFYSMQHLVDINMLPLLTSTDKYSVEDLMQILEKIYLSFANIHHMIIRDFSGNILYSLPEYSVKNNLVSDLIPDKINNDLYNNYIIDHTSFRYSILEGQLLVEFITPLINHSLYYFQVSFFSNANILLIFNEIGKMIAGVFVSIWLTALSTLVLNFFLVESSINKVSSAIKDIAQGNFAIRIECSVAGNLGNLIFRFNEMAERLEFYEKKNVEQLTLEKLKLETLVSIIADGAILLDKELRIIFINQSASKTFKFLKSCIIGTYIFYYFPPYINEQLLPILNQMIDAHSEARVNTNMQQLCITIKSDITKTFKFIITTVLDADNKFLTGIAIIIQDITHQVGLDEAKAQFISNISHELRTPLFNIRSFLETLSEFRSSLTEKQQIEFLDIANQETQRLTCLVNDVLDLSRLESDFLDAIEVVELYDIIPPAVQTSQLRANEQYIDLSYRASSQVHAVSGYTNLLIQVLSNLIGNSLKFTSLDGRITVKAYLLTSYSRKNRCTPSKVRIEVIDEGCGIREFDQSRIFDRFVRLENNVHTLEGTGLGLSIVKNIIDKHNSKMYLYSESGLGSSFWFDLPVREKKN